MSTTTILIAAVALHFLAWAARAIIRYRRFMRWLRRDMALLQAHRDYMERGWIEEALEIRQVAKREAAAQFSK